MSLVSLARRAACRSIRMVQVARAMSLSTEHGPALTVNMAADIQETHTANLKNDYMMYATQLSAIKARPEEPFHKRWQETMHVFMTSQLHTLLLYGYTPDENGVRQFTTAFDGLCRSDESGVLLQRARQRHVVLVDRAFGVSIGPDETLSLEQARHISSVIALRMQSNDFLEKIDKALEGLDDMQAKQEAIMGEVVPLQIEVAGTFGFAGDDGFLKMQCLMMQHSSDDQISYNTLSGLMPVYRRAGVSLGEQGGQGGQPPV